MIAKPVGKRMFQLFCSACKKPGDTVTYDEMLGLSSGGYGPYVCFECDNRHIDEVPASLMCDDFPYFLKLGKDWYLIDPWKSAREGTRRFQLALRAFQRYIDERREEAEKRQKQLAEQ